MKKFSRPFVQLGLSVLGCALLFTACTKGTKNASEKKVSLIHNNMSITMPIQLSNGDNDSITSFYYKMNMDSFVKSYGQFDTSDIRTVKLKSCILNITNGDSLNNFRNLHSVNIGITSGANDNITRMAVFTDIVDTNAYRLEMPGYFDPNLAAYYKDDSVRYRIYGNFRRATTKSITGTADIQVEVTLQK